MHKIFVKSSLILALIILLGACSSNNGENIEKEELYTAVEIETLTPKKLYIENILSAKIYANKDIYIIPTMIGKVEEVRVEVGDIVSKDDVLFVLNKEDIEKQVKQAKTVYDATKANYDMTVEQIDSAKKQYERTKELFEQGAVSEAQYEQAKLGASDKPLDAADKSVEQARLAYEQALDALNNVVIKAPIDGTITSVDIEVGEYATNSQPSMVIMNIENLVIKFGIAEDLITKVSKGDEVTVEIPVVDYFKESKIENISSSVDQRTGLYNLEINIENNGEIKPGMFSKVYIKTDRIENALAVKSDAVITRNDKQLVYVAENNYSVEKEVITGLDTGEYVEILSGLKEDDKIIIKGQNYVSDGSKIKVVRGQ